MVGSGVLTCGRTASGRSAVGEMKCLKPASCRNLLYEYMVIDGLFSLVPLLSS
ncbi:hypothetical protein SLEP1_g19504 [Rubroshorea leprosula]|uniref:Uncharacterized protein n=1 Tax=Rubroshorea leprosula TaxID=152421 RepID=A0AAV5J5H2_9ROSI|nr:hypothetical protein SLEP1_g19504 [Rubroshorea leprosula]